MSPNPSQTPPKKTERCHECSRDLHRVAPRYILRIGWETYLPDGKARWLLVGKYCSQDCLLDAFVRGKALHHAR